MRYMLVFRPRFPIPPDAFPAIIDGCTTWWETYRDRFESAGFFAGGSGGGGICTVADEAELNRMMIEWPLGQFSQIEVHPLLEIDVALEQWNAVMGSGAGSQGTA